MRITVDTISEVTATDAVAVIINYSTKWVTTLPLASTLRNAGMPTIVIDCESTDGSAHWFERLGAVLGWDFYWLSWPMRPHGETRVAVVDSVSSTVSRVRAAIRVIYGPHDASSNPFPKITSPSGLSS